MFTAVANVHSSWATRAREPNQNQNQSRHTGHRSVFHPPAPECEKQSEGLKNGSIAA